MQPPATSHTDVSVSERLDIARRMLADGNTVRVIELLDDHAANDPTGESFIVLGDASFLAGQYDRAERAWRAALALRPDNVALHEKAGRAALNVVTGMSIDEPQFQRFSEQFNLEWLLGGPHPGESRTQLEDGRTAEDFLRRLSESVGNAAGAALGTIADAVVSKLAARAGAAGITTDVWTNWHTTAGSLPESLRPAFQLIRLAFMRDSLFANNLVRPYADDAKTAFVETTAEPPEWALLWRTADGSWNDLRKDADGKYDPMVGAAYTRFFRNVGDDKGLDATWPRENPGTNPVSVRELSRALFAPKGGRTPAPFLNVWAASWIQFMIHDWISHGNASPNTIARIPLADDDPMRRYGIDTLGIPATAPDITRTTAEASRPPTFVNEVTHWWDGSQLYGSDAVTQHSLRAHEGGRLALGDDGLLPTDATSGLERTGFVRNWWLGLGMLHTLFVKEHNAICEHLAATYPSWDDERLFQTARLINAALMAKIHTVEWTPAVLPNRTLNDAMRGNWYGVLASWFGGEKPSTLEPINIPSSILGGIVGGPTATFARYGLSEEFAAVYRMHSLLPDAVHLRAGDGTTVEVPLLRTRHTAVGQLIRRFGLRAIATAMGEQNCFALVANNYPAALLDISTPEMPLVDLGALDLFRDRERGVPRYNQLRMELGLERVPGFDALTDDPATAATLRSMYGVDAGGRDRIDDVDLLVGTLCEGHRPAGFGFGETLFQIFILNASWRLLADRFYTADYRPEIYTPEGLSWIDNTTFKDVLLRHHPGLEATGLGNVRNAFEPWDEGRLDPSRHPTRAFDAALKSDPWAGERAMSNASMKAAR